MMQRIEEHIRWVRLEKEIAAHASILAWKIPWTEKPGRLLFIRVAELDTTEVT